MAAHIPDSTLSKGVAEEEAKCVATVETAETQKTDRATAVTVEAAVAAHIPDQTLSKGPASRGARQGGHAAASVVSGGPFERPTTTRASATRASTSGASTSGRIDRRSSMRRTFSPPPNTARCANTSCTGMSGRLAHRAHVSTPARRGGDEACARGWVGPARGWVVGTPRQAAPPVSPLLRDLEPSPRSLCAEPLRIASIEAWVGEEWEAHEN